MRIVIEGAGEVGSHLAKMLRQEGNDVVVIDNDPNRIQHLNNITTVETVCGDPSSIKILKDAEVDKANLFIAVYPRAAQEINIVGALLAKKLGAQKVIARIDDEDYLSAENKILFKDLGIELLFYPEKTASDEIVNYLKHNSSIETLEFARGKLQIDVFKLNENSPLLDLKLSEFIKRVDTQILKDFRVIAISRGDKTIIPSLNTKFHFGDMVFVITKREAVQVVQTLIGTNNIDIKSAFILGGSRIAEMLATSLSKQGMKVKIVERNRQRSIELSAKLPDKILISCGDGRNSDFLCEESISEYDAFIALTDSDESNVLSCVIAKKLGVLRTIAEVENLEYIHLAEEMGVDNIINKKLITTERIFRLTLSGMARFVRYMAGTNTEVMEYTVKPGSAITKAPLRDIDFPSNAIIGGVIRGSDAFIAVGDTQIQSYDRVAIFTLPESIKEIDSFFK